MAFNEKTSETYWNKLKGCSGCIHLGTVRVSGGMLTSTKYRCSVDHQGHPRDGSRCNSFAPVNPQVVDCYDRYRKYYNYFILTAIYKALNMNENDDVFEQIKTLIECAREDESTKGYAFIYDNMVGEKIAECLASDPDRVNVAKDLFLNYINYIYVYIGTNNTDLAIQIYREMVIYLYNKYNLGKNPLEETGISTIDTSRIINPDLLNNYDIFPKDNEPKTYGSR